MAVEGVPEAEVLLGRAQPRPEATRSVREFLTRTGPPPAELSQISVSRLVNPAHAYWELVHPLAEDLVAHQKRLAGTGAHDLLEEALAAEARFTEIWLQGESSEGDPPLDRITARLDAAEPLPDGRLSPTEIKNVGTEPEHPSEEHLEQLAMYCALEGVEEGRLLHVLRNEVSGTSRILVPWKVRFPDLTAVRREMVRRRDLLTEAFERKDPSALPSCRWWSRGCKFQAAGICHCGDLAPMDGSIARSARSERDPEYLELLRSRARARVPAQTSKGVEERWTLGAFLTPRKIYFASRQPAGRAEGAEGTEPETAKGPAPSPASTGAADPSMERSEQALQRVNLRGLERQVFAAVRRASAPAYRLDHVEVGGQVWNVPTIDGRPFLVRVRHVARALRGSATELAGRWGVPEDLRQLAVRASLLKVDEARVYVWNWKVDDPELKLQCFDVGFRPSELERLRTVLLAMPLAVGEALKGDDHRGLPLCPRWMCPRCDHLAACAPDG